MPKSLQIFLLPICCYLCSACQQNQTAPVVVVYTSVDQVYSEPILNEFTAKTGIKVLAVYDVEASKTTGLVNRLISEKNRPQADIFWSGEFAQTILLREKGILASYVSPAAAGIPRIYRDPEGYWTGFSGRGRVLLVNTEKLPRDNYPTSISDLLSTRWPADQIGMANPIFGTTATHAAALYAAMGATRGKVFFEGLSSRGVRMVEGNSAVRDLVACGQLSWGVTDTDDAHEVKRKGAPVEILFPDQSETSPGTLIIPNTVAMIAGTAHRKESEVLIDYLLSTEVEEKLVSSGWCHIPLRPVANRSDGFELASIKSLNVPLMDVYNNLEAAKKDLIQIFLK